MSNKFIHLYIYIKISLLSLSSSFIQERTEELLIAGETPEGTLTKFEELLKVKIHINSLNHSHIIIIFSIPFSKYRMMEISLNNKQMRLQSKLEDLSKSVSSIEGLRADPSATFPLRS